MNQGMIAASSAATQALNGPAIRAARAPKRSSKKPLIGMPAKRPTDKAVTNCAALPGVIAKLVAKTGIVGSSIAHMPDIAVLA